MKIDLDNNYLFLKGNKNNLVTNPPEDAFEQDFTLLVETTPDVDNMIKEAKDNPFYTMCIIGKNGKHIGLFVTAGTDELGKILYKISFEWWEKTDDPDVDTVRSVDLFPTEEEMKSKLKIIVQRKGKEIYLEVNGKGKTNTLGNVIDYSNSYTWIGSANRLHPEFNHIYLGELFKLHLQKGTIFQNEWDKFFNQYQTFVEEIALNKKLTVFFTSNFENFTDYKVRDDSYNANHIIKFSKEWLD